MIGDFALSINGLELTSYRPVLIDKFYIDTGETSGAFYTAVVARGYDDGTGWCKGLLELKDCSGQRITLQNGRMEGPARRTHNAKKALIHLEDASSLNGELYLETHGVAGAGPGGADLETYIVSVDVDNDQFDVNDAPSRSVNPCTITMLNPTFVEFGEVGRTNEETVTASGALTTYGASKLDSSGGAISATLGSGTFIGQIKTIVMTNASNASTVSVANHETSDPEVGTFDAVDETWVLIWTGTEWATLKATCEFL